MFSRYSQTQKQSLQLILDIPIDETFPLGFFNLKALNHIIKTFKIYEALLSY